MMMMKIGGGGAARAPSLLRQNTKIGKHLEIDADASYDFSLPLFRTCPQLCRSVICHYTYAVVRMTSTHFVITLHNVP